MSYQPCRQAQPSQAPRPARRYSEGRPNYYLAPASAAAPVVVAVREWRHSMPAKTKVEVPVEVIHARPLDDQHAEVVTVFQTRRSRISNGGQIESPQNAPANTTKLPIWSDICALAETPTSVYHQPPSSQKQILPNGNSQTIHSNPITFQFRHVPDSAPAFPVARAYPIHETQHKPMLHYVSRPISTLEGLTYAPHVQNTFPASPPRRQPLQAAGKLPSFTPPVKTEQVTSLSQIQVPQVRPTSPIKQLVQVNQIVPTSPVLVQQRVSPVSPLHVTPISPSQALAQFQQLTPTSSDNAQKNKQQAIAHITEDTQSLATGMADPGDSTSTPSQVCSPLQTENLSPPVTGEIIAGLTTLIPPRRPVQRAQQRRSRACDGDSVLRSRPSGAHSEIEATEVRRSRPSGVQSEIEDTEASTAVAFQRLVAATSLKELDAIELPFAKEETDWPPCPTCGSRCSDQGTCHRCYVERSDGILVRRLLGQTTEDQASNEIVPNLNAGHLNLWMLWMIQRVSFNDPGLRKLDLSCFTFPEHPRISPRFLEAIGSNTHLEELLLCKTELRGGDVVAAICSMLKQNCRLKSLDLQANHFELLEIQSIFKAIAENAESQLEHLKVNDQILTSGTWGSQIESRVGVEAQQALAECLQHNHRLLSVDLEVTQPHWRDQISRSLVRNIEATRKDRRRLST